MACLRQVFTSGLRFQRRIEYQVQTVRGLRWQLLPTPRSRAPGSAVAVLLAQALALQCWLPGSEVLRHLRRLLGAGKVLGFDAPGLQAVLGTLNWPLQVDTFQGSPRACGQRALQAIEAGGICIAWLDSHRGARPSLLVGVETRDGAGAPEALLLLDTQDDAPWACGHNARLTLRSDTKRAGASYPLTWRDLTGRIESVRLLELWVLRASEVPSTHP